MEVDFDKEIDTLLRKARGGGPVYVGDIAGSRHLDADEISAFAENAMPEKSRSLYTAHLADCNRCRNILSQALILNADAAPVAASSPSVITIAERSIPWYKRLFLFPNLAYVMGSLVLMFGGLFVFTIVRNTGMGDAVVSQVDESEQRKGGPNFQTEPAFEGAASSSNTSANAAANVAAPSGMAMNSNAVGSYDGYTVPRGPLAESEALRDDRAYSVDGVAAGQPAPPPPPAAAPVAREKDVSVTDSVAIAKEKSESKSESRGQELAKQDSALKSQQYPSTGNVTQSGPSRNNENQYNRQLENLDRRREPAKKSARDADEENTVGRRAISGRAFERKQGVWYDTAYAGRPTINIRRGSAEFNKLDAGLKSIANSLPGTIVVVWGAKAYRIQ